MSTKPESFNGSDISVNDITPADEIISTAPEKKPRTKSKKNGVVANGKGSDGVNGNLETPLDNRELLRVLSEVRNGNFTMRMSVDQIGLTGKICDTLNEIISLNELLMLELT